MKKIRIMLMTGLFFLMLLQGCGSTFVTDEGKVYAREPGPGEMEPQAAEAAQAAQTEPQAAETVSTAQTEPQAAEAAPAGQTEPAVEYVIPAGPDEWKGKWIWNESNTPNSWMRFRKKVTLDEIPAGQPAMAYIAADSRYWLYVNGQTVVREGSEKRGQRVGTIYYDAVDLTGFLKPGENTISMLVWYWGPSDNSSYVSTSRAAMYFQMDAGGKTVVSDESWKVTPAENFVTDYSEANTRLPEKDVWCNAETELWTEETYDDAAWPGAIAYANAGGAPYGEMVPRQIPMIRDLGVKEYENGKDYVNYTVTAEKETLELKMPYNGQILPRLTVSSDEPGKLIVIKTDAYSDPNGNSVRAIYVTKEGEQEFECYSWMNGGTVLYEIPAGVTVKSLDYREVGYDTSFAGSFSSDDPFYNEIWKKAQRTLYVCMHDTYMDCPTRERAQWFADMAMDMQEAAYCMGTNKEHLYKNGLRTEFGWTGEEGGLSVFVPVWGERQELPIQMLMGFNAYWDYYLYTGDKALLEEIYEPTKAYLLQWQVGPNKQVYFMRQAEASWWADTTGNADRPPIENAWFLMMMKNMEKIATEIGREEDLTIYQERYDVVREGFQSYWNGDCYMSPEVREPDERANALAVLAGIADPSQYDKIAAVFENYFHATPLLEYYVESACVQIGRPDLAEMRMKRQYDGMINGDDGKRTTTLWEYWSFADGSQNHAWSGGPLVVLSRDFAGLAPLTPGWERFRVRPQMGSMKEISCTVPTPSGLISAQMTNKDNTFTMKLTKPQALTAEIGVPVLGDKMQITVNGEDVTSQAKTDGNFMTLDTPAEITELEIRATLPSGN